MLRVPLQVSVTHISDREAGSVLHLSVEVERHLFGYLDNDDKARAVDTSIPLEPVYRWFEATVQIHTYHQI